MLLIAVSIVSTSVTKARMVSLRTLSSGKVLHVSLCCALRCVLRCGVCCALCEVGARCRTVTRLAQLVERWPFKPVVVGSSPTGGVCFFAVGPYHAQVSELFLCVFAFSSLLL